MPVFDELDDLTSPEMQVTYIAAALGDRAPEDVPDAIVLAEKLRLRASP